VGGVSELYGRIDEGGRITGVVDVEKFFLSDCGGNLDFREWGEVRWGGRRGIWCCFMWGEMLL